MRWGGGGGILGYSVTQSAGIKEYFVNDQGIFLELFRSSFYCDSLKSRKRKVSYVFLKSKESANAGKFFRHLRKEGGYLVGSRRPSRFLRLLLFHGGCEFFAIFL